MKTVSSPPTALVPITTMEEISNLTPAEREVLRASLDAAEAEIASGGSASYDVGELRAYFMRGLADGHALYRHSMAVGSVSAAILSLFLLSLGAFGSNLATAVAAESGRSVPVMVTAIPDGFDESGKQIFTDSCSSTGTVQGLDKSHDGFLSVRSGPGAQYPERSRVRNGQILIICNNKSNRPWLIIIVEIGSIAKCFPRNIPAASKPYSGPCRSGWVNEKYVGNFAD